MSVWKDFSPMALKSKVSHFCSSLDTTRTASDLLLSSQVNVKFAYCQKYSSEAETVRAQAQDTAPAAVQAVPLRRE